MSREENVFGLDVRVNSRAEMLQQLADGEPVIFGVTRCDGCSELCWYDPVYAVPGVTVLCLHSACPPATGSTPSRNQVGELRRLFPGRR